ncbi:MAG: integrase catalytic domain-containing protein [Saprospiraceae bacterium]|nr:integrase catalytic domain-containing protein [Candidatus Defluviibacterium haderslevense]
MTEIKHNFYLKDSKSSDPTPINYQIFINGKRLRKGIGYSIHHELWDIDTQRPTESKELINKWKKEYPSLNNTFKNINARIFNFKQEAESYLQTCINNRAPIDKQALIKQLEDNLLKSNRTIDNGPKQGKKQGNGINFDLNYILDFTNQFVKDITNGKRTIQTGKNIKERYSDGTIKTYRNFQVTWDEFEKEIGIRFKWTQMNKQFYDDLNQYLNNKDYKKNTSGKIIKSFKVIAQAALDDSIHQNTEFRKPYFKTLTAKVDNIYLTLDELAYLENLDQFINETWEKARDIFLLGCYTALRFSDLKRINKGHIQSTNTGFKLNIITQKTKEKVIIPLKSEAFSILEKYNFKPPKIEEQTVNRLIKEIAKRAGICTQIEQRETTGGKTKILTTPKHDLLTTHTGRRTGATQMYLAKIDPIQIMKITGHTSESNFMKYICITKEEAAEIMAENQFFK